MSYFIPFYISDGPQTGALTNPLQDRIYLQSIPLRTEFNYVIYFNPREIFYNRNRNIEPARISYFKDSLLAPELSLFSNRGDTYSHIGGTLKTPLFTRENQLLLVMSNRKETDTAFTQTLVSFKFVKAGIGGEASLGYLSGKTLFSLSNSFKNFSFKVAHGSFWEAHIAAIFSNRYLLFFHQEDVITTALTGIDLINIGLDYDRKEITPRLMINWQYNNFSLGVDYGKVIFGGKMEKRWSGYLTYKSKGLTAGVTGKIGKGGVFYYSDDSLRASRFIVMLFGEFIHSYANISVYYTLPEANNLHFAIYPRFSFKNGEVGVEPGVMLKANTTNREIKPFVYLSLFLFKSVEFRGSYCPNSGLSFGAGVNLLD
ncbi:MAG: hypothetical protein ACPLN0_06770 [Candidatus Hydrothermia bacterium]